MEIVFQIESAILNRSAEIHQSDYSLTILRQGSHTISVDRIPLIEYYVFFDSILKADQIKIKLYKTVKDGKWYDASYSEEAELNSPEFGIPVINVEIKKLIALYESRFMTADNYA